MIIPKNDRWAAFDPATGEQLWRRDDLPLHGNLNIPGFWRASDGTPVVLVFANGTATGLIGLHAESGETLFTTMLPAAAGFESVHFAGILSPSRSGNPGNMTVHGNALVTHEHFVPEVEDEENPSRHAVAVYDLSLSGFTPRWRYETDHIRGEWSPLVLKNRWVVTSPTPRGIMAFDIETGELMSEAGQDDANEYTPGGNGLLMAMEDIVISQRDMTHGNTEITFFKIDDAGQLTNLNPEGHMTLASINGADNKHGATSYHQPLMQAVADGRIFMREARGMMAYDLRTEVQSMLRRIEMRSTVQDLGWDLLWPIQGAEINDVEGGTDFDQLPAGMKHTLVPESQQPEHSG